MTTVTIAYGAIHAKLIDPSREAKLAVQQILSYSVAGAEQTTRFKTSGWDGRSSFFAFRECTFPAGFVQHVAAHLRRSGFEVSTVSKPLPEPLGARDAKVDDFGSDPRYDYQDNVVDTLVKHGKIIAQIATGGGKSRVAKKVYARIRRPTLFLTTRSLLMYQMKDSFEKDMGIRVGVLGDGQFGYVDPATGKRSLTEVTVAMVQTLNSRLEELTLQGEFEMVYDALIKAERKEYDAQKMALKMMKVSSTEQARILKELANKQEAQRPTAESIKLKAQERVDRQAKIRAATVEILSKFEVVILEEAHEASGAGFYNIMSFCRNAHYRIALTATPFMKSDEEANMRLMAVSGPVGIRVTEKMLIDRGILAKPYFKFHNFNSKPLKIFRSTAWQSAYRLGIVEFDERNNAIVIEAAKARRYGLTTMVLVQHKAHGEALLKKMDKVGLRADFIFGESDHDTRKAQLARLASGELDVLIGSTILDVGVDCPAVGMIILAGGGKAEVALRQRIGRGLRFKKHGPNVAFVVDFNDSSNDHLRLHSLQRRAIIEGTEGFCENIIANDSDFDFEGLGFKRVA